MLRNLSKVFCKVLVTLYTATLFNKVTYTRVAECLSVAHVIYSTQDITEQTPQTDYICYADDLAQKKYKEEQTQPASK